jgi:hypothetical protein
MQQATAANPVEIQKARFLEVVFGVTETTKCNWPGCHAYLNYIEEQLLATGSASFEPLLDKLGIARPATLADVLGFVCDIAAKFATRPQEGLSIDEILQLLLEEHKCQLAELDPKEKMLSRQAIFRALSWLTMVFIAPTKLADGKFQMDVTVKHDGLRVEQSMEIAKRPISILIRGFGQLLPSTEQITSAIERSQPDLLHATSLNFYSLKLIDKIRIEWTSSLGCHLMFSPLSRTLTLYRFPTFCAMNCNKQGAEDMVFDK